MRACGLNGAPAPLLAAGVMAPAGNATNGAKLFKAKCATCHTCNEGGPNKQGPNLYGVMGRQSGQVAGFKYTKANKESGITWGDDTLFAYLVRRRRPSIRTQTRADPCSPLPWTHPCSCSAGEPEEVH